MLRDEMNKIYSAIPLEKIPWNNESPPPCLVELINSEKIKPCKAVDLGCGAGNYALFLATLGFEMTGIDISDSAINIARQSAADKNIKCDFITADLTGDISHIDKTFDFAYDYEVLHHICPQYRGKYIFNVLSLLNNNAGYFSVCFSEHDTAFGSKEKYRKTPLGTELYFSSENELKSLYEPYFKIEELKTIEIKGKTANHLINYALLTKL
jgi:cyclopropane fatty-acyl-phospholipid synthase-like methyltransferase